MIQIIQEKRKPSFGEKFSNAIGTGIQGANQIMQGLEANNQAAQRRAQLQSLTGIDAPEEFQQKAFEAAMQRQLQKEKYGYEADIAAQKLKGEKNEEQEAHQLTQNAFNRLVDLYPSLGRGSDILGYFGGKTAEKSGEFTSLTGALESHLVEMVNRGTLSNTRFKYITENLLPKPTDTRDTIKGKLKGLAQILNLDMGKLGGGTLKNTSDTTKTGERKPLSSFSIGAK